MNTTRNDAPGPGRVASAQAGYAIARRLHLQRTAAGWRALGRKIGFTNRTIWSRYGVYEPIFGYVYDRTVINAPQNRVTLGLDGFAQPRMEPEICFGLRQTPPRTKNPAEILACIDWIAHSIEIVQCELPGWTMQVGDATAANGLHGALIVGQRVPVGELDALAAALPSIEVTLRHGRRVVDRGIGANVLDSPLLALAHLVELLTSLPDGEPLAPGDMISTGTLTDAAPVAPGETWSTQFAGIALPGMTVTYA